MSTVVVSHIDIEHLNAIRKNVAQFLRDAADKYATKKGRLLDIAPQVHEGARPFFHQDIIIDTFDIDPNSGCTYTGDICKTNHFLSDDMYDYIVCTEVLEHVLQPFDAVKEIWRLLKAGGKLFLTTPFNFRIHGPLPDCWRFTEHGLRTLLSKFAVLELCIVETIGRPLMPIHYTIIAEKVVNTKDDLAQECDHMKS
jgi:SAM-dependent methyltransferase